MKRSFVFNKPFAALCILIFICFFALSLLFPYSGDDWAWGSQIGLDRLKVFFNNYNGRYAGNLLVIPLTHLKVLNAAFKSLCFSMCCLVPVLISKSKSYAYLCLSILLAISVPKSIFVQAFQWTSGFANYVPPIIISVFYIFMINSVFENRKPDFPKIYTPLALIMALVGSLFMENLTLYNIFIGLLFIFYSLMKFKKVNLVFVMYFIGSVIGAAIMFSNEAYRNIINSNDGYRSTAMDSGVMQTLYTHTDMFMKNFVFNNLPILIFICILGVILVCICLKKQNNSFIKLLSVIMGALNILSITFIFVFNSFPYWKIVSNLHHSYKFQLFIMAFLFLSYLASLFIQIILITEKAVRDRLVFLSLSFAVIGAPLFVVTPIGPRCFYPLYFVLSVFAIVLSKYVFDESGFSKEALTGVSVSSLAAALACFVFLISIYSAINNYDTKRVEFAQKQNNEGSKIVYVSKLPYNSFVWQGEPKDELWAERFKLFYGIDDNAEIKQINYKEFDKKIEN